MFKRENAKLHRFCQFSPKLRTKRKFFLKENLDIISLMLYNIIHKRFKLLDKHRKFKTLLQDKKKKGTGTVHVSRSNFTHNLDNRAVQSEPQRCRRQKNLRIAPH